MKTTTTTSTTLLTLLLAGNVAAFWRMPCRSHTGVARVDPLVSPMDVADHSHIVFGSGNFGMNSSYKDLVDGCTSCGVTQDKSAYWTPPLYFQHKDGTVEMVPNVGGMLAYYLFYLDDLEPFPEGFSMIAGNPTWRNFSGPFPDPPQSEWPADPTDQFYLAQRAIGYNCLNYAKDPEASLYRHVFPDKDYMDANCKDGLRLEMAFPSCGNGDLDSENHRDHMRYPSLVKTGKCPEGFDHHYPFLFFETIWATNKFAGIEGKFLVSTGDPVGASYHADFIMGWESADFLGSAIKTCTSDSGQISDCPLFDLQEDSDAATCTFPVPKGLEDDDCHGPRKDLPVGVPVQYGPECATKYPVPGRHDVATSSTSSTAVHSSHHKPTHAPPAAHPSGTPPAYGGIVVPPAPAHPYAKAGKHAPGHGVAGTPSSSAPGSMITTPPAYTPPTGGEHPVTTKYITKANEVVELIVEEVDVYVSDCDTVAAETPAAYKPAHKHKRHLENHQHRHMRR